MVKMSHVNLCSGCIFRCLAGSDCLFISECSLTHTSRLRAVSPLKVRKLRSKKFMTKLYNYTKGTFNFHILWQTHNIKTLFKLKDKNIHPSHVIYISTCTCNQAYIESIN